MAVEAVGTAISVGHASAPIGRARGGGAGRSGGASRSRGVPGVAMGGIRIGVRGIRMGGVGVGMGCIRMRGVRVGSVGMSGVRMRRIGMRSGGGMRGWRFWRRRRRFLILGREK